jgi:hypothetical protein
LLPLFLKHKYRILKHTNINFLNNSSSSNSPYIIRVQSNIQKHKHDPFAVYTNTKSNTTFITIESKAKKNQSNYKRLNVVIVVEIIVL